MAFEKFTKIGGKSKDPKMSFWSRGQISFNLAAVRNFGLNPYNYVILSYNKETNTIRFEFKKNEAEGALKVRDYQGLKQISGLSFIKYFGIKNFSGNYDITKIDNHLFVTLRS